MNKKLSAQNKGFTLIELMVVISIISLLSSIVFSSLNSARLKARDSIRKQILVQLRNALEIYYSKNGSYPSASGNGLSSDARPGLYAATTNWIPGLVGSGSISELPTDPSGSSLSTNTTVGVITPAGDVAACNVAPRAFLYFSNSATSYKLISLCGPESTPLSAGDVFYDSRRPLTSWQICAGSDCAL